jgi:hypothetical protein
VPAPPPRDVRLDLVRGWLQLTIFFSHAAPSFAATWLVYGHYGFSDSSEQFVFLSGLALGSVFARNAVREGRMAAWRDMLRRTWRLYRTHLITFACFGAMMALAEFVLPGEAQRLGWGFLMHRPLQASATALTLLYQPEPMGILPVFIWCMLLLPGFELLQRRFGDLALAAPVALYLLAWVTGWTSPSLAPETGIPFNPLDWQLIFMLGAWIGRRRLLRGRAIPRNELITVAAVAVMLFALAARLADNGVLAWPAVNSFAWEDKEELVVTRLAHAMALAWLVARFMPRDAAWMHGLAARVLSAIGRHSLQVFCVGLFLSWAATAAFRLWPAQMAWVDPLMIGCGVLILSAVGWRLDRGLRQSLAGRNARATVESSLRAGLTSPREGAVP